MALAAAAVLGGTIGWLLTGGSGSSGPQTSVSSAGVASSSSSAQSSGSASSVPPGASSAATHSAVVSSSTGPVVSKSAIVSAGAVTVTAVPPTARPYQAIEISGTVEGATPGTTLEFARKDGATLATTQVGRAGAYRLTVKLGRSGTFVVRAVDGATVLATSTPFALTVH